MLFASFTHLSWLRVDHIQIFALLCKSFRHALSDHGQLLSYCHVGEEHRNSPTGFAKSIAESSQWPCCSRGSRGGAQGSRPPLISGSEWPPSPASLIWKVWIRYSVDSKEQPLEPIKTIWGSKSGDVAWIKNGMPCLGQVSWKLSFASYISCKVSAVRTGCFSLRITRLACLSSCLNKSGCVQAFPRLQGVWSSWLTLFSSGMGLKISLTPGPPGILLFQLYRYLQVAWRQQARW